MGALRSNWDVLATYDDGCVLRFEFHGNHHYSHGPIMSSYMQEALAEKNIAGIVIDLLDYEYEFGNDVAGVLFIGFDRVSQTSRPVCIVAQGRTRAALLGLFGGDEGLRKFGSITFASSTNEALDWLRSRSGRGSA